MGKKVECADCKAAMNWALPEAVSVNNYEYAKCCLYAAEHTFVCDVTGKIKNLGHKQQCKHFRYDENREVKERIFHEDIQRLRNCIAEYEQQLN